MARLQGIFTLASFWLITILIASRCCVSAFVVDGPMLIRTPSFVSGDRCHKKPFLVTTHFMSVTDETKAENTNLPFFLDPNTKGGVLVLMTALFIVTWLGYQLLVNVLGYDEIDAGIGVGMGFTVLSTLAWMSTYLFRVATKDMTYAKQLKDYENAVIAKRLEELDDDEVQALVEEVTKDSF